MKKDYKNVYDDGFNVRLTRIISRLGGLKSVGTLTGYTSEQVSRWKLGKAKPPFFAMDIMARQAGVSLDWLATGAVTVAGAGGLALAGDTDGGESGIVRIPLYEARAAAGAGTYGEGDNQVRDYIPFTRRFLVDKLKVTSERRLGLVEVMGDSMEPTVSDGDLVLIDLNQAAEKLVSDGIFAFVQDGWTRVKRFRMRASGGVDVISDNPHYESEFLQGRDIDNLQLIGRVRWIGHLC